MHKKIVGPSIPRTHRHCQERHGIVQLRSLVFVAQQEEWNQLSKTSRIDIQ